MRVLITTDVVGGVWQFTRELATGLLNQGSSVALVSFGGDPSADQLAQCAGLKKRHGSRFLYESSSVPLEWMQQNSGAYQNALPTLMNVIKEFQPDLLHSNQFCFGAMPVDIPRVVTAHSDVLSWAEVCRDGPLEPSAWLHQYQDLVTSGLAGASLLTAPTRWMLDAVRRNFPVQCPTAVISNGRSLPKLADASPQMRAVTAGRLWDEAKDIRILADVASPMPLYVAGEVQHEGATAVSQRGRVSYLGRLREDELLDFFRQSAIYICTSRYEPFGLAPLEAALCGCVVLARNIPSLHEVWQEGALYFDDPPALSQLLHNLAGDPAALQAARYRSGYRARAFSSERMVASYCEQFSRIVAEAAAHVA
jgi:glycogen synthase